MQIQHNDQNIDSLVLHYKAVFIWCNLKHLCVLLFYGHFYFKHIFHRTVYLREFHTVPPSNLIFRSDREKFLPLSDAIPQTAHSCAGLRSAAVRTKRMPPAHGTAVRCPANVCSCKHGSRLPVLSHKKQNTHAFHSLK